MSARLAELLAAAEVECEKEMNDAVERGSGNLPREWFAYNVLQRKIRQLYHAADQQARRASHSQERSDA